MGELFRRWLDDSLVCLPERGMAMFPVKHGSEPYDAAYWDKYVGYANTDQGRQLTAARLQLTNRYARCGPLVDVGIGCGQYIEARNAAAPTYGYDVNPVAVAWLEERGFWWNIYERPVRAATFWDVLEHIPEPERILAQIGEWCFVSLPIFAHIEDALRSHHLRRDEHVWYWTRDGFINWMQQLGWKCREHNTMESLLGRADIGSFAFERVDR